MSEWASRVLSILAQLVGSIVLLVLTALVAALLAFGPLTALPGELQTDFVNGHGVKLAFVAVVGLVFSLRLAPLAGQEKAGWWASSRRFAWVVVSTFVGLFWSVGLLVWLNAYGVGQKRSHDMVVTGYERTSSRTGGSAIANYELTEIGTGWEADLEDTDARAAFVRQGSCVRITVREGRLGLDWISDARPLACPPGSGPGAA